MDSLPPSFALSELPLDPAKLSAALRDPACGGFASFEGWVRNHHRGQPVTALTYEAYPALALAEGQRILAEAAARWPLRHAACVHRVGALSVGEIAVWVGVSGGHRDEVFAACRWIIDEVKARVPIWKKEHFAGGETVWVDPR